MTQQELQAEVYEIVLAADPSLEEGGWPQRVHEIRQEDPLAYARGCDEVRVNEKDTGKCLWCLVAWINGFRRQAGLWNIYGAVKQLEQLKGWIEELPDGHSHKNRLLEMHAYHGGQLYWLAREFDKAAECHEASGQIAARSGNQDGEMNSRYMVALCNFYHLFTTHSDEDTLIEALDDLMVAAEEYKAFLSNPLHQWHINCLCQQFTCQWLLRLVPAMDTKVDKIVEYAKNHPEFGQTAKALQIMQAYSADDHAKVIAIASVNRDSLHGDWLACVLYVYALSLQARDRLEKARKVLNEITDLPNKQHGGSIYIELAKKQLAQR